MLVFVYVLGIMLFMSRVQGNKAKKKKNWGKGVDCTHGDHYGIHYAGGHEWYIFVTPQICPFIFGINYGRRLFLCSKIKKSFHLFQDNSEQKSAFTVRMQNS